MDPSSSNFNCEQKGIITYMDTEKCNAALEGNVDAFKDYSKPLDHLVTRQKNTILHIYLSNRTVSTEFVNHISEMCPSLLKQANIKGETPLHIAARHGHDDVVKVLIERAKVEDLESGVEAVKVMLRMTTKEKNTALHEAVRRNHVGVVKVLIEEDPDFPYSANDCGETPLYMAAMRGYGESAAEILENCTSKDYSGPHGKTALHAAVIRGDEGMTRKILEKTKTDSLTQEADQKGRIPLHYASDLGHNSIVKLLLEFDKSAAYIPDRDGKIALHIAASRDHYNIMLELLRNSPDCCELVDNRGWNVFHFAMGNRRFWATRELCSHSLTKNLVNEKDFERNTPLHLLAASWSDKDWRIYLPDEVDIMVVNQRNQSAIDILSANDNLSSKEKDQISQWLRQFDRRPIGQDPNKNEFWLGNDYEEVIPNYKEEVIPELEKAKEYHLVVAALIATVTFAAAFTVPGGYISERGSDPVGTAVLRRSSAFKAFVITNAMAMVSSTSAVFIHFLMALGQYKRKYVWIFLYAFLLTVFAMWAMVVAFVTGTYAVLRPSPGLAIVTCLIGLSFFLHLVFAIAFVISNYVA